MISSVRISLSGNTGSMTEEERQANISLGMEKSGICGREFYPGR